MNRAGVVTLDVGVDFTLDLTCDRCLKEFKREFVYDFTHTLVRELHGDNDDYVVCENNVLELEDVDENKIRWEADDEDGVIKLKDGKIEAVGAGSCEIEVYSTKDENVSDSIEIVVFPSNEEKASDVPAEPSDTP